MNKRRSRFKPTDYRRLRHNNIQSHISVKLRVDRLEPIAFISKMSTNFLEPIRNFKAPANAIKVIRDTTA